MYVRATDKFYVSENMQFTLIRIERFLKKAMKEIGAKFEDDGTIDESFKAAVLLVQNVRDTKMSIEENGLTLTKSLSVGRYTIDNPTKPFRFLIA